LRGGSSRPAQVLLLTLAPRTVWSTHIVSPMAARFSSAGPDAQASPRLGVFTSTTPPVNPGDASSSAVFINNSKEFV